MRSIRDFAEDFATGASSIRTLGRLQEHGCTLYELPSLHAKVFLVPGLFASIGSQNLTRQGTLNKEATTVFTDPRAVATVQLLVERWLDERRPITPEMITDVLESLSPLVPLMRRAREACDELDARVRMLEGSRIVERLRLAEEKRWHEAELQRLRADEQRQIEIVSKVASVRERMGQVCPQGAVNWATAAAFVESSFWWATHPSGPVPAGSFKNRLTGGDQDWKVRLGD